MPTEELFDSKGRPVHIEANAADLVALINNLVYYLQVLPRLSSDPANRLRVIVDTAIASGTSRIGYVNIIQKLLAVPYSDTSTNLSANATYTGTSRDCQLETSSPYGYYAGIIAVSYADVAGTLFVQESSDASTWRTVARVDATDTVDTDGSTHRFIAAVTWKAAQRYVRLVYRNGAGAQSTFNLSSRVVGSL